MNLFIATVSDFNLMSELNMQLLLSIYFNTERITQKPITLTFLYI